jgi:hypothetical protein
VDGVCRTEAGEKLAAAGGTESCFKHVSCVRRHVRLCSCIHKAPHIIPVFDSGNRYALTLQVMLLC